jgi:hypothetical protein
MVKIDIENCKLKNVAKCWLIFIVLAVSEELENSKFARTAKILLNCQK